MIEGQGCIPFTIEVKRLHVYGYVILGGRARCCKKNDNIIIDLALYLFLLRTVKKVAKAPSFPGDTLHARNDGSRNKRLHKHGKAPKNGTDANWSFSRLRKVKC